MQKLFNTDNLFFMSSSGHCALTCPYCLIEPVAKNEPSLDRGDFRFLFEKFKNKKNGFIFSGKGDFFASYKKRDELLSFILAHDVEVMLDINGQFLQECPHLPQDKINKIKQINITMHYQQLKEKSFLSKWARNVKILYKMNPGVIILNTIMSPPLIHLWEEALSFYEKYIFQETRIKLLLICDVHVTSIGKFHEHEEKYLLELLKSFPFAYVLGDPDVMNLDFIEHFKPDKRVRCPAGQKYFRFLRGCYREIVMAVPMLHRTLCSGKDGNKFQMAVKPLFDMIIHYLYQAGEIAGNQLLEVFVNFNTHGVSA